MPTLERCIYCPTLINPSEGEGDHVVPDRFGRFLGGLIFRRICQSCNSRIGHCEQQLFHSGPESLPLRLVNPQHSRRRDRGWGIAPGGKRPEFSFERHGTKLIGQADPSNPRMMQSPDQAVFKTRDGSLRRVFLYPGMQSKTLRQRLRDAGFESGIPIILDAENPEHYVAKIREYSPDVIYEHRGETPAGTRWVLTRIHFTFHADYFRALAKVGFHYYLLHTRRGYRGDEPLFQPIRDFIMNGGDHTQFFHRPGTRFLMPFGRVTGGVLLPSHWCHILAMSEERHEACASISLFAGPERLPRNDHITIARFPSGLVVPGARSAHTYIYDTVGLTGRYDGFVHDQRLSRIA